MTDKQLVEALKRLPVSNLQQVEPQFKTVERDPKIVKLENDVNVQMNKAIQALQPQAKTEQRTDGIKLVGPEEALKELLLLLNSNSTDNKS